MAPIFCHEPSIPPRALVATTSNSPMATIITTD